MVWSVSSASPSLSSIRQFSTKEEFVPFAERRSLPFVAVRCRCSQIIMINIKMHLVRISVLNGETLAGAVASENCGGRERASDATIAHKMLHGCST